MTDKLVTRLEHLAALLQGRLERLAALNDEWGESEAGHDAIQHLHPDAWRFALIQSNGEVQRLTLHSDLTAAGSHCDDDVSLYPQLLVDLNTGQRFYPETTTRFYPSS